MHILGPYRSQNMQLLRTEEFQKIGKGNEGKRRERKKDSYNSGTHARLEKQNSRGMYGS
jgi:hypothetical protein